MTVTRGNSLMNCIKWRKERTEASTGEYFYFSVLFSAPI